MGKVDLPKLVFGLGFRRMRPQCGDGIRRPLKCRIGSALPDFCIAAIHILVLLVMMFTVFAFAGHVAALSSLSIHV